VANQMNGATPLFAATQYGRADIVKLLIDAKADVNAALKSGITPLFIANQQGFMEIIELLEKAHAKMQ